MQGLANNGVNTRELQRRINRRGTEVLEQIDLTADQDDAVITASDESSSSQLGKYSASAPEPAASSVMTKGGDLKDPLSHVVKSEFHAKGRGETTTWQENLKNGQVPGASRARGGIETPVLNMQRASTTGPAAGSGMPSLHLSLIHI